MKSYCTLLYQKVTTVIFFHYMSGVYITITVELSETILLEKLVNIKDAIEISAENQGT